MRDSCENNQLAGMDQFLEFVDQTYPEILSQNAENWLARSAG